MWKNFDSGKGDLINHEGHKHGPRSENHHRKTTHRKKFNCNEFLPGMLRKALVHPASLP